MKPTLEEVKKYFKDAKEVVSTYGSKRDIITPCNECIHEWNNGFWFGADCKLWDEEKGFAKILTTKEKTFSITAEQLMQLENGFTLPKLKEWFPEVFEVKLEVGKWYRSKFGLFCITKIENDCAHAYGFDNGVWRDTGDFSLDIAKNDVEATDQEVFKALKNEAVKRGFVEGAWIEWDGHKGQIKGKLYWASGNLCISAPCDIMTTKRLNENFPLMIGGIWAKIIPTCTRKEAEKLLNKKIID